MNESLNIYNGFGISPTNTFISAGMDYYIPNIVTNEQKNRAGEAFLKSYNITMQDVSNLISLFTKKIVEKESSNMSLDEIKELISNQAINILHLYLALQSIKIEEIRYDNNPDHDVTKYCEEDIEYFIYNYLVYDNNKIAGICVNTNDSLLINSGIKVALNPNDAGLYVNKSGMGNKGWDVRACLVDEDYSGYVHLSCAYTKNTLNKSKRTIYCGDKFTQMMIMTVKHYNINEVSSNEYNSLMENSERGDKSFGHSDVVR